jgi:hypothetical protein
MEDLFDSKWTPWVLGLGGALAVYFLFFSGGSSSPGGTVGYNAANLQLVAMQAQLGAQTEQARIAAETTDTAALAGMANNLVSAKYGYELGSQQVAAGVATTNKLADTALAEERLKQITNRQQIAIALPIAQVQASTAIAAAKIQGSTAQNIAQTQQTGNFLNTALGLLPKLFGA